ncbi:beta-ketoacyl-ACP synthase III [Lentimicrobium sp.]|jgi:3-oxoacyl-[acyl-carrier-protein] synthase-3|uniref:beta-ketoacyl-ACP synthase III n=1 Tax=Lentimicrobium sp. TaxID=2034841 RepID=UPI0025FAD95E|nr:beta-ketoacyl-ACP synthase III [Lentimicrobium sp.]MCO5257488.1 ketoacyl-ACP synthase III [Lentimicrobium sp.]MCO5262922.1 ketoacyl-ACP synthase III [Lentimicrobium sp.]HPF65371.1 beta-ketoacyl-ACP synthase III [Lentimicrobium sp.]HPJ62996.1 beta-ketoacyl-ACP synthase III [Lentimicrobium sp.]HPR26836.1 beta-ketoacyl-ACP synthase III [Lentimicrobium sp.]
MTKIRAAITGVGGFVPEYILSNDELSRMVDTSDEWIMTRIGIKERRILKGEGKGTSDMGAAAVRELLRKTNTKPEEVDMLICGVVTPDMLFPATANIIADKTDIRNAFGYDMNAGCSSFLYALTAASKFVESGSHKKVIVVGADKMSSIVDYTDRATCPIFGDGAAAVLLEPVEEEYGLMDAMLQSDGVGRIHLHQKAGGSVKPPTHETIDAREHYIYQEGQAVFKWAVSKMADVSVDMMKKHGITAETLNWLVPHQANMRIIEATAQRMGIKREQVMINIQRYGNTTSATLPLCLWEWENQLRKGDNIILAAFGAGFTWGAVYLKWAYDGDKVAE